MKRDYYESPKPGFLMKQFWKAAGADKYILSQRSDLDYTATDLSNNMIGLAEGNNLVIKTLILDCRSLSDMQEYYDGVVSAFCLPYLNQEEVVKKFTNVYK